MSQASLDLLADHRKAATAKADRSASFKSHRSQTVCRFIAGFVVVLAGFTAVRSARAQYHTIASFSGGPDGTAHPRKMFEGSDGVLYGTSLNGGLYDKGTIFKINKDGTGYALLWSFAASTSSNVVPFRLIEGQDKALYGMISGFYVPGTLYKINKDGTGFTILKTFDASTGYLAPWAGVIQGRDGALYGTTWNGGSAGAGTVFKINPDGSGYTVLLNFFSSHNDYVGFPRVGVIEGSDGALYGAADNFVYTVRKDGSGFAALTPVFPEELSSDIIEGSDGALYGVTDGYSLPTRVFTVKKDGTGFRILGSLPQYNSFYSLVGTGLVEGPDGMLYGTAVDISPGWGWWFSLNKEGSAISMQQTDIAPESGLILGSDGMIYGTTDGRWDSATGPVSPDAAALQNPGSLFQLQVSAPLPPPTAPNSGTILADSSRDFSATAQDANGWLYGYFYGRSVSFQLLTNHGTAWTGIYPSLSIDAQTQYPSVDGLAQVSAVRRWTSTYEGNVRIVGRFEIGHDGDGVGVTVLLDGQPVIPRLIIGNSGTTEVKSFNFVQAVHHGTTIDFAVDPGPGRDDSRDTTQVAATIESW
ncbi:MAG TPA: choice-of-anchor tandem repeat GloVer-containing protein [Opitutaceae bacterium]|nr:choice-of-anchor tandem repeat GloVer-containing protein [Opitutaceae bacterium]